MSNNKSLINDSSFQDYCKYFDIRHYGDRKTYENINWLWKFISNNINYQKILDYNDLIDVLIQCHTNAANNRKVYYQSIIMEFQAFQNKYEEYIANYSNLMTRLKGYSHHRKCKNLDELKQECSHFLKRMRLGDNVDEETREFIIIARYICDYLEITPEDIPSDFFITTTTFA
jgi:CRISPR/Cas system CSM-associated protein Csm2 small subunit